MFQGFLSLYLWALIIRGEWTTLLLIKVSLYSLEQKHRGSKIYYNRMKRGINLAERESGDAGEG